MAGRLIYVMGPSGAGKDSVLEGLRSVMGPRAYLAPRLITRAATPTERNAISVSHAEFERLESGGHLAMCWRANGLAYGVPRDVDDRLAAGHDVLLNGSREYLPQAQCRYPDIVPVLLVVQPALLRQRLQCRGREDDANIERRLARNTRFESLANGCGPASLLVVDNSGKLEDTIDMLLARLKPRLAAANLPRLTWAFE